MEGLAVQRSWDLVQDLLSQVGAGGLKLKGRVGRVGSTEGSMHSR